MTHTNQATPKRSPLAYPALVAAYKRLLAGHLSKIQNEAREALFHGGYTPLVADAITVAGERTSGPWVLIEDHDGHAHWVKGSTVVAVRHAQAVTYAAEGPFEVVSDLWPFPAAPCSTSYSVITADETNGEGEYPMDPHERNLLREERKFGCGECEKLVSVRPIDGGAYEIAPHNEAGFVIEENAQSVSRW